MQQDRDAHAHWLVATKLQPPRLNEDVIPRQRLFVALQKAVESHLLTLVSAPAGYGKTTLLALLPRTCDDLPTAWLSIDEEDNDPFRFLAALTIALQRLAQGCGATYQTLLTELSPSANLPKPAESVRRIVGRLINDVVAFLPNPSALVLDDLHRVTEPAVYGALDYLLERLPSHVRIVISSRHDPPLALARLRARGQLAELRLANLRFTLDETEIYLNDRLRLGLSHEDSASLHTRTEGWPAGLRLLASSLEQIGSMAARTAFITHLTQTGRHVFDFLADEVLACQSAAVRTFLLETSILPELAPVLCQAVTGRSDASDILEEIYRRNLFLVAADEAGTVYRYHHLFAEFLRRRLVHEMPGRVAELRRRAAEAESVPSRAISHYLAANLWVEGAQAVEQVAEEFVRDGLLGTLRGWIEALPASVRDARPRLLYFLGVCALQRGALDEASAQLERARHALKAHGDEAGVGLCLLELVSVASSQFAYERQAAFVEEALAHPLPVHGRVQLLMARAFQSEYQGNWDGIEEDVDQAIRITLESRDPRALNILGTILRLDFTLLPNGPQRLERYCRQVLARVGDKVSPAQAGAQSLLGFVHFLRGRLNEGVKEAERACATSEQLGGLVYVDVEAGFVSSFTAMARGDYAAAERYWATRLMWFERTAALNPFVVPILFLIGRAEWMQGNLDQARQTYERMCTTANTQELPEAMLARALMGALLEISDGQYAAAEQELRLVVDLEQRMRQCLIIGSARLLLAHLYLQCNRPREALFELAPILAECERNGTPGWILKEGAAIVVPLLRFAIEQGVHRAFGLASVEILGAGRKPRPMRVPDTGKTLTSREVQVLRLVATGASNEQIARHLVLSRHTVKAHITHIFDKLAASSRTGAAARARDLHLI